MPAKRSKPSDNDQPTYTHWLIKAEPDSRIEKGIDVKFSIDDLEEQKTSTWEGVRNHEAKKFLKLRMKVGHLCLFYASNCKVPGVSGIAKVCKEGYPDHNAWDPKHPYHDPKSKKDDPTWYMVDVEFVQKLPHLVPLSLLQVLSSSSPSSLPPSLQYLTSSAIASISTSPLLTRGRLSVQPASEEFFETVRSMGEKGGWVEGEGKEWFDTAVKDKKKGGKVAKKTSEVKEVEREGEGKSKGKGQVTKKAEQDTGEEDEEDEEKVGGEGKGEEEDSGKRRSKRAKKA
ncbi:hypothetical protein JCM11251_004056 [Rhodosporidiobolus azoricus]